VTEGVLGLALLKSSGPKGRTKLVQESANKPATATTRERVLANIAESKKAREASNLGKGLSYEPAKISGKNIEKYFYQQQLKGYFKGRPTRASAAAKVDRDSFVAGSTTARRTRIGEAFENFSGLKGSSGRFLTKGMRSLNYEQRQHLLALPLENTANRFKYLYTKQEQIHIEGLVGTQKGGTFVGEIPLKGGGFQSVNPLGNSAFYE